MKKQQRVNEIAPIIFKGVDCQVFGDELTINLPVIDVPRCDNFAFNEGFYDWSRDQGIEESAFIAAAKKAEEAFYTSLEEYAMLEYLMEHKV